MENKIIGKIELVWDKEPIKSFDEFFDKNHKDWDHQKNGCARGQYAGGEVIRKCDCE